MEVVRSQYGKKVQESLIFNFHNKYEAEDLDLLSQELKTKEKSNFVEGRKVLVKICNNQNLEKIISCFTHID